MASTSWLKFYPSDWRADPMLRMCSIAARGLWIEMLCLMHESGGYLRVNGVALNVEQLANLAQIPHRKCTVLVAELQKNGVFSVDENGVFFSRRILKDLANAKRDQENGRLGGNPKLKEGVNPPDKASRARVPDTRSQKEEEGERALARARPPKIRMAEDWEPSSEQRALARAKGFSEDRVDVIALEHRAFWLGLGKARTEQEWEVAWRKKVLDVAERSKNNGGGQAPEPSEPAHRQPRASALISQLRETRKLLQAERDANTGANSNVTGRALLASPR